MLALGALSKPHDSAAVLGKCGPQQVSDLAPLVLSPSLWGPDIMQGCWELGKILHPRRALLAHTRNTILTWYRLISTPKLISGPGKKINGFANTLFLYFN